MRTPTLLAADGLDNCLTNLRDASFKSSDVRGMTPNDWLVNFLTWHSDTERMLVFQLAPEDINHLLFSQRFWTIRSLDGSAAGLIPTIEAELKARAAALDEAYRSLEAARVRWRVPVSHLLVPDSNLLLHHPNTMLHIPWRELADVRGDLRIVLLLKVIDELDARKRDNKLRTRARATLKEIASANIAGNHGRHAISQDNYGTVTLEVLADDLRHERLTDPDSEIVDRAAALGILANARVKVATYDTGMQVRAGEAGVDVKLIPEAD